MSFSWIVKVYLYCLWCFISISKVQIDWKKGFFDTLVSVKVSCLKISLRKITVCSDNLPLYKIVIKIWDGLSWCSWQISSVATPPNLSWGCSCHKSLVTLSHMSWHNCHVTTDVTHTAIIHLPTHTQQWQATQACSLFRDRISSHKSTSKFKIENLD